MPKFNLKRCNTKKEITGFHWNKFDPPQDFTAGGENTLMACLHDTLSMS